MLVSGEKSHCWWNIMPSPRYRWFKIYLVRRLAKPTLLILCEYLSSFIFQSQIPLAFENHVAVFMPRFGIGAAPCAIWYVRRLNQILPKDLVLAWSKVPTDGTVKQRQIKYRSLATTSPQHKACMYRWISCLQSLRPMISFVGATSISSPTSWKPSKISILLAKPRKIWHDGWTCWYEILISWARFCRAWSPAKHPRESVGSCEGGQWMFIHLRSCFFRVGGGWVKEKTSVWAGVHASSFFFNIRIEVI